MKDEQSKNLEPDQYFQQLSSLILKFTTKYFKKVVLEVIESKDDIDEIKRFYFTVISKTVNSLEASNILIRNFEIKRHYHPTLFIGLRSIVMDIIIAEYVIHQGKTDEARSNLIMSVYSDHIESTLTSLEKTDKLVYGWTDKRVEQNVEKLKELKPEYFDGNGKLKYDKLPGHFGIIKQIFSNSNEGEKLELLRRSYRLFSDLSKYVHLGDLSNWLIYKGYNDSKMKESTGDLHRTVRIALSALNNYAKLWDELDDKNLKELQQLENEIILMSPDRLS